MVLMTKRRRAAPRRSLFGLVGNARVCIILFPLWSIPYSFYFFYLSLYLREYGVADSELGALMFVGSAASVVFSLIAAPVVDNLGRKKATFLFDLLSSAAPPLIFAISGRLGFAFAGIMLMNANKIMSVAYYLLMSEDSSDEERVTLFNLFNIILVAAGIFIPVTSGLVDRFGVLFMERVFLIVSCVSMTILAVVRNQLVRETRVGMALLEKRGSGRIGVSALLKPYAESLGYLFSHPVAAAAAMANVLFYVYYIIGTNNSLYFTPFFGDALGIDKRGASFLGSLYSAGMLLAMVVLNPLFRRRGVVRNAVSGALVDILGLGILILAPRGSFLPALAGILLSAIGFGMLKSAVDAGIVIMTEGEARAGIYSTANILSSLLGIAASALCGLLYGREPRFIYLLSIVLLGSIPLCFALASRTLRQRA